MVLFADFGDDAPVFEIHFWITIRNLMDRRRIESDLRFRIDELFRQAGICIAFPQRDVHLDAPGPLEVRVLTTAEGQAPRGGRRRRTLPPSPGKPGSPGGDHRD